MGENRSRYGISGGAKVWRSALLLVLVAGVLLAGCAPQATAMPTEAPKTPRPTFTAPAQAATGDPAVEAPTEGAAASEPNDAAAVSLTSGKPRSMQLASPEYGMQAFLWWKPEVATRDVQLVSGAGFGWIKQGVGWRDVEPAKGEFIWNQLDDMIKWLGEQRLDMIVRLDHQPEWAGGGYPTNGPPTNYADFGDFCYALASRYKGSIRAYEVWNEPNLAREWGGKRPDPVQYAELLKVAYSRIKEADPEAIVVSAGLSPTGTNDDQATPDDVYLEGLYQAMGGSSEGYFDALGAHAPGFKAPPEASPDEVAQTPSLGGQRFFCFRRVEDLRAMMVKYGDTDKQIYILEMGWTSDTVHESYAWHAVTEEQKADYLVRAYQYAKQNWAPWIGLMSLIYICDPAWTEQDEQYWWAVTYPGWPDFQPRPAYEALKAMPK